MKTGIEHSYSTTQRAKQTRGTINLQEYN